MNSVDDVIVKRNNDRLFVWTNRESKGKLKKAAETVNMSISDFVRRAADKYVSEVQEYTSRKEYSSAEITGAINQVKNGYKRIYSKIKQYFTEPEDAYLVADVPVGYEINPQYR